MRHQAIRFERERHYAMSVREAWNLLADTDSINRGIGLPSVEFSPVGPVESGFVRKARAKAFRVVPVRWKEYPFDWVRDRRYAVRREFESGPIAVVEGGVELSPQGDGVLVKVFSELTPANMVGRLITRKIGSLSLERLLDYCDRYLSDGDRRRTDTIPVPEHSPDVDRAQLDRLLERLRSAPVRQDLADRLRERIVHGRDSDVSGVRPYSLADEWGVDRLETLRLLLHATRLGLFNLRWELMCPTCRVPKAHAGTLAELPEQFHCETCAIDYEADFDKRVELRFTVHPAIRAAEDRAYCIGGPFRTPHIVAQQSLEPHETRELKLPGVEPLELRATGGSRRIRLPVEGGRSQNIALSYDGEGWSISPQTRGSETLGAPEDAKTLVRLSNETNTPLVAVLEEAEGSGEAVTAAEVTALQEFRDLFSSEVLAPGQEIGVQNIVLVFSDLKGSTSLYEDVGDASAYRRVNRHFDFLGERIAAHRGSVVKTIGDAVMGAFFRIEDALGAALSVQRDLAEWCETESIDPPFVLRMGVHRGPVVAVNANGRLDYFGRTVNVAARIERESEGGDVVLLREVFEEEGVQAALSEERLEPQAFAARLQGLEGEFELVRLQAGQSR